MLAAPRARRCWYAGEGVHPPTWLRAALPAGADAAGVPRVCAGHGRQQARQVQLPAAGAGQRGADLQVCVTHSACWCVSAPRWFAVCTRCAGCCAKLASSRARVSCVPNLTPPAAARSTRPCVRRSAGTQSLTCCWRRCRRTRVRGTRLSAAACPAAVPVLAPPRQLRITASVACVCPGLQATSCGRRC